MGRDGSGGDDDDDVMVVVMCCGEWVSFGGQRVKIKIICILVSIQVVVYKSTYTLHSRLNTNKINE